jgi:hypothetical protein
MSRALPSAGRRQIIDSRGVWADRGRGRGTLAVKMRPLAPPFPSLPPASCPAERGFGRGRPAGDARQPYKGRKQHRELHRRLTAGPAPTPQMKTGRHRPSRPRVRRQRADLHERRDLRDLSRRGNAVDQEVRNVEHRAQRRRRGRDAAIDWSGVLWFEAGIRRERRRQGPRARVDGPTPKRVCHRNCREKPTRETAVVNAVGAVRPRPPPIGSYSQRRQR